MDKEQKIAELLKELEELDKTEDSVYGLHKVLVCICAYDHVKSDTIQSVYRMQTPGHCRWSVEIIKGTYGIALARGLAAYKALDEQFTHLMFVDWDIVVPPDALKILLAMNGDVSCGWYMLNERNTSGALYDKERNHYGSYPLETFKQNAAKHGVIMPVDACGFGCVLIKTDVFSRFAPPWFNFIEYPNRTLLSEDLYFCDNLRRVDPPVQIYCDTSVRCSHIKERWL